MYALLTDGSTVEIRPARPQDADAVRTMHAGMSQANFYLRFFSTSSRAAGQEARRVCRKPDSEHAALLAWQGDRLVGVATYEPAGKPGVAEVSFAVPDDMHDRGIASLLLEHLIWQARQRDLRTLTAETMAENSAMLRVFADADLPAKRRISGSVVKLAFDLPGREDADRPFGHRGIPPVNTAAPLMRCCGSPGSPTIYLRSANWTSIRARPRFGRVRSRHHPAGESLAPNTRPARDARTTPTVLRTPHHARDEGTITTERG